MTPQINQNGPHQKVYKQMLRRVWRKRNAVVLLVGMQIDTATIDGGMEIPLKTRNKITI